MIRTADLHLEFAHIYADTEFGVEQMVSVIHAKKVASQFKGRTISAVLVDDLHIDRNTLNIHKYVHTLKGAGLAVDHLAFESRFDVIAEQIIARIPEELLSLETFRKSGKQVLNLLNGDQRIGLKTIDETGEVHTCALLSAAWTLCRLGAYEFPHGSLVSFTEAPLYAHHAISVLDGKYDPVERKVRNIMNSARHGDFLDKFTHVFYEN